MADMTAGGKAVDPRDTAVVKRRMEYEIQALRVSIMKQEVDILQAERNIGRMRESIDGTEERIQIKQAELEEFVGREIDG